jgi:ABC-type phosphate/phosphonate transport system substrate-binding protein
VPERETWTFGIARSHAVGAVQSRLKELCALLSNATGVVFLPHHAASYGELAEGIRHGRVGAAWMPPLPAIELEEEGAATPLVLPLRQESASSTSSSCYHAALVMRDREARAKSMADLRGMRIAWVAKDSAAGYLVPRMHLASLGIDPRTFFSQETFARSHLAVVDAVVSRAVDVGATFCTFAPGSQRIVTGGWTAADGSKVRDVEVVATVGPIPNDAIVASTRVSASVRAGLTRWFLTPDERTQGLLSELFHARSLRLASSAHFDELRHLVRAARSRGYDA